MAKYFIYENISVFCTWQYLLQGIQSHMYYMHRKMSGLYLFAGPLAEGRRWTFLFAFIASSTATNTTAVSSATSNGTIDGQSKDPILEITPRPLLFFERTGACSHPSPKIRFVKVFSTRSLPLTKLWPAPLYSDWWRGMLLSKIQALQCILHAT